MTNECMNDFYNCCRSQGITEFTIVAANKDGSALLTRSHNMTQKQCEKVLSSVRDDLELNFIMGGGDADGCIKKEALAE
jgi:hypothetical protein